MKLDRLDPREQLAAIMGRIYQGGMTTLSGGNLSILDPHGRLWITPAGLDKGRLSPQDIVCVEADGTTEGLYDPSSEYPFHRAIYGARPDLGAIAHAHSPALVAFSIARRVPDTRSLPQVWRLCGAVGYAPYALTGSEALGENIATTFVQGFNVVLLENHGVVTAGQDLLTAFQRLETFEFYARTLLKAHRLGQVTPLTEAELTLADRPLNQLPEFIPTPSSRREQKLRQELVETVQRACDRQLMTSTQGIVSVGLGKNRFLITPAILDRRSLTQDDIVLIRDGKRERGKLPSRSVQLHAAIYRRHPDVRCVTMARSPNVMAFAVTGEALDTRTIPESYILLRDVPKIPYGILYREPERIATTLSERTPVVIVQNDCVLAVGADLSQAFDRLEVAEFSARSLIDTTSIGPLVPIGEQEIRDLESAFPLR